MRAGEPLADVEVQEAVSATGQTFANTVDVADAHFNGPVSLLHCAFARGAKFRNTTFESGADFAGCHFAGVAYFWRSRFGGDARFDDIVVEPGSARAGSVDPGEFNLSWAHFRSAASLVRARLHGPARLWRTLFLGDVTMDQALFADLAVFNGLACEVSIDLLSLGEARAFEWLHQAELARPDPEVTLMFPDGRRFPRFAQLNVRSATDLERRLAATALPPPARDAIVRAFRDEARPMFAPDRRASLRGIEVRPPGYVEMIDVDLRSCHLLGTPMAGARLSNVHWPRRRLLAGMIERYATADERDGEYPPEEGVALQRLYHDLAANYKRQQDLTEARWFRIAEREVVRAREPFIPRALATAYRQLAVYGESPGVALSWLVVFVLLLFPSLFVLADLLQDGTTSVRALIPPAVVRSLEVSTFLDEGQAATSLLSRLIAGIERIAVGTQAAFFVLALKRLFPR